MASVGQVFYDVLPNLDGFAAKVAAGVGKQKPVKIKVEADTKSAEASAKRLTTVQTREAQLSSRQRMALIQRDAIAENRYRDRSIASTKRASAQKMALIQRDAIAENKFRDRAIAVRERDAARQVAAQAKITASQQKAAAAAAAQQKAARGQAAGSLGTGLLVGGAATIAALGGIVKVTADFDSAVSNVASTGKEASASIGQLRQEAIKYGASTAFSATEAANAQAELIKANVSVTDTITGGLKGALDLAAAGSLGVADAAGIMGTTLSQFKLPGTDASHVADLLAAAAGKAQGEVSDFAEALKYVGPLASSAGVSLEETTGVLAEFANQGILGSQAGTALRGIFLGLTAPVGAGAKAIEKYGINVRDASGNFIGLEGAAGELQKRLGGLSKAQRDAALAAIFGRNQVTAATVLYEEGAAGVAKWSAAVSESGFAARTAATKMDNLKGDVEKLKGALDSAFVSSGGGGTAFLRDLAQGATAAVDGFNGLPKSVQEGTFKLAALAGAGALAAGGIIKIIGAAAAAKTGLAALGLTAGATRAKLALLNGPTLLAAAGFIAAQAASAGLQDQLDKNSVGIDGYKKSLDSLDPNKVSGDLAKFGDSWALAGQGVKDTTSAFVALKDTQNPVSQGFRKIGDALGMVSTAGTLAAEFDKIDKSLVQMNPDIAAKAFSRLSDQARGAGLSTEQINSTFDDYKAKQEAAASATGAAASAFRQGERDFANGAAGVKQVGEAAGYTADELATMNAEIYAAANSAIALSGGAIAVEAAMDSAAAAAKKNGENLNISTDAGRANKTELDRLVATTNQQTAAMNDQGKGIGSIAALNEKAKKSWIDTAVAMGKNRDKAKELADELFVLPTEVTSQIVVSGAKVSAREAKDLNAALKGIPKEQRARIVTIANTKGAKEARIEIAKVKSKSVIAKATGKGVNTVKEIDGALKKLKSKGVRAEAKAAGKPAVNALDRAIRDLKSKRVQVAANASGHGSLRSLQSEIGAVRGKTVYITVKRRSAGKGDSQSSTDARADGGTLGLPGHYGGGTVRGMGGPREDNIAAMDRATGQQIAWVSATEEVVNARSSALNRDIIKQINANPGQRFGLVGLAGGGTIDGKASKAATSNSSRPLILNIDMGDLGIRRIVTEIVEDRDEYSASIGRM
jgi:TP901 family phage tail tape measure protein